MLAYDSAKHGLGLGESVGTLKGLNVIPQSYLMRYQSRDTSRIMNAETRWLQDGKVSQWSQKDFSGGAYQCVFKDPSMFYRSQNMLPSKRNPTMLRTCQSVEWYKSPGGTVLTASSYSSELGDAKFMFSGGGALFVVGGGDYVWAFTSDSVGKLTVNSTNCARAGQEITAAIYNDQLGRVLLGYDDGRVDERYFTSGAVAGSTIREWQWDDVSKDLDNVDTNHRRIDALGQYGAFIVVGMKDFVYYFSSTSDKGIPDGDGHCTGTPWTYLDDVSQDVVVAFENHRSELYIMSVSSNGYTTALDMTTLVAGVLQWQQIPYMFFGQSLKSYAGRLYVGGAGYDIETGNAHYAQLFELTGNSLRELRVWYDLPDSVDGMDYPSEIPSMTVFEGQLFLPNGASLEAYDFITDSFFTSYTLNDTITAESKFLLAVGSNLFVWADGTSEGLAGVPRGNYQNSDAWVELSEFDEEPAILKRWGFCEVHSRYGSVDLEVSLDGGENYTSMTRDSVGQAGYKFVSRFDLSALSLSTSIKLRVTSDGYDYWSPGGYYYREIQEVVVGFLLDPPKLRQWDFGVIVGAEMPLLDGEVDDTVDVDADVAQFHTWYEDGTLLLLRDRDGNDRQVMIVRLTENEVIDDATGRRRVDLGLGLAELSLV